MSTKIVDKLAPPQKSPSKIQLHKMKIKKTPKKEPGFFPYTEYKSGKMRARVFEDLGGDLVADLKNFYHVREDGNVNDWINEVFLKIENYKKVYAFLLEIHKDLDKK